MLVLTGGAPLTSRQLPGGRPVLSSAGREYHFFFNAMPDGVRPDSVVVRNKCLREAAHFDIAPANSLLMLSEPSSVCMFPSSYTGQFGRLHTCQASMRRPNASFGPAALPWFVGFYESRGQDTRFSFSYDDLAASPLPAKTKRLSVITSAKCFTRGHVERLRFVRKLLDAFPGQVDVFGRGFREVADKWEALAPYRYTIAIENCRSNHYWTEKLSDAILAGCHVIYSGAPNVREYFPRAPITEVDVSDFPSARAAIEGLLTSDPYDSELELLLSARRDVMGRFNIFHLMADYLDQMDFDAPRGGGLTLRPVGVAGSVLNILNRAFVWNYYKALSRLDGLCGRSVRPTSQ